MKKSYTLKLKYDTNILFIQYKEFGKLTTIKENTSLLCDGLSLWVGVSLSRTQPLQKLFEQEVQSELCLEHLIQQNCSQLLPQKIIIILL